MNVMTTANLKSSAAKVSLITGLFAEFISIIVIFALMPGLWPLAPDAKAFLAVLGLKKVLDADTAVLLTVASRSLVLLSLPLLLLVDFCLRLRGAMGDGGSGFGRSLRVLSWIRDRLAWLAPTALALGLVIFAGEGFLWKVIRQQGWGRDVLCVFVFVDIAVILVGDALIWLRWGKRMSTWPLSRHPLARRVRRALGCVLGAFALTIAVDFAMVILGIFFGWLASAVVPIAPWLLLGLPLLGFGGNSSSWDDQMVVNQILDDEERERMEEQATYGSLGHHGW